MPADFLRTFLMSSYRIFPIVLLQELQFCALSTQGPAAYPISAILSYFLLADMFVSL
jgi:hypothetical protein